ncbi:MAG: putative inositol-monophosphatase [Gammaproteobacteria bacterium]|nr:putative inositol-monophosphatase [Gammaproteobacteria bacterium]
MECDTPQSRHAPDSNVIETLEHTAVRLARAAGDHICAAYNERPAVDFKTPGPGSARNSNPVSRTDRAVESLLRAQLAAEFPDHAVIGEEQAPPAGKVAPFTWVIDPVDGTTNFINGLPLFGSSIGVLFHGRPIAGAIWCAATHTLKPGVYHARTGGALQFDGRALKRRAPGTWRGLASEPGRAPSFGALWDTRVLGCATLEFAFVAAGLLSLAYIPRPALWDAVAGLVLLSAADCRAVALRGARWETLLYFDVSGEQSAATLARWSEPLLLGDESALACAVAARGSAL